MAEDAQSGSLEYTPTWIVAVICFIIGLISLIAERGLHRLGKFLKRRHQDAPYEALQKLQAASKPVIQVDADVAAPPPPPVSLTSEFVVYHVMENAKEDEPSVNRLVRKNRARTDAKAGGSGVATAGEAIKLLGAGASGSQGGRSDVAGAASQGRSPIIPETGPLVFETGLDVGDDCTSLKSAKTFVELIVLHALKARFSRRHLFESLDLFDSGLCNIINEYVFLKGQARYPHRVGVEAIKNKKTC
ncbi:MLO-like protein 13 [Artemisia annua]|uniref:MLO-like protein 13 n=1 Tax=Artemisia annua TaxID=35608 RepID=A0A2U1KFD4_ARTAN|nr:MLO-like protein 13 [Artemisia annua]